MGEVKLSSETKETEHPYKNNVTEEVHNCAPILLHYDTIRVILIILPSTP